MSLSPDDYESPNRVRASLGGLVRRITPNCRKVVRLTSEERDHALPFGVRTRLGLHRHFCLGCARYALQLDLLHKATLRFPEQFHKADTPTLNADAKARIKRALREQIDS